MTPTYAEQLADGQAFERLVEMQLKRFGITLCPCLTRIEQQRIGENRFGLEIKLDRNLSTTGNVYIEVAERANAHVDAWHPSGIWRPDNTWLYGVGNPDEFYVFCRRTLQRVHAGLVRGDKPPGVSMVWTETSRGFVLSRLAADSIAARVFTASEGVWYPKRSRTDMPIMPRADDLKWG